MTCTLTAVPYTATTVVTRSNRATNPSMETSGAGWEVFTSGGAVSTTRLGPYSSTQHAPADLRDGRAGAYFLRTTWTTAATSVNGGFYVPGATVTPGEAVVASVYTRSSKQQRLAVLIDWLNGSGTLISTTAGADVVVAGGSWTRLSASGVAPSGTASVRVTVYARPGASGTVWAVGDTLDVDALLVEPGTTELRPYFDGNTPSAGLIGQRYQWAGVANLSSSFLATRTPAAGAVQVTPRLVVAYGATRAAGTVLHAVIGRPDPVPALRTMRTRTGGLDMFFLTYPQAVAAQNLYAGGGVVLLREDEHPGMDMYHVAMSAEVTPASDEKLRWLLRVEYAEVYGTVSTW